VRSFSTGYKLQSSKVLGLQRCVLLPASQIKFYICANNQTAKPPARMTVSRTCRVLGQQRAGCRDWVVKYCGQASPCPGGTPIRYSLAQIENKSGVRRTFYAAISPLPAALVRSRTSVRVQAVTVDVTVEIQFYDAKSYLS
jgi:hypothetical protein